jgi:GNAT superfamily N-acetyltransferase
MIVIATQKDLIYLSDLQKRWSNNVGWLPRAAHSDYIDRGHALRVDYNGTSAGYLIFSINRLGILTIPQVAIDPELLRTTLGTQVMRHAEEIAITSGCSIIRLRSRDNLTCNKVWPELGMIHTATIHCDHHQTDKEKAITIRVDQAITANGSDGTKRQNACAEV